jgi:hypothetical protein
MNRFIIRLFAFLLIPILFYITGWTILKAKFRKDLASKQIFIFGDSQTWNILSDDIYNRSLGACPYFVHYEFANEFIEEIKGKPVYIGYNYHNLTNNYQQRLYCDSIQSEWMTTNFRHLDEYSLLNHIHTEIRPTILDYYFFDIKKMPVLFKRIYFPIAPFVSDKVISTDSIFIQQKIDRFWIKATQLPNDKIQNKNLIDLILLLKKHNCKITLLKMPNVEYYERTVPENLKKDYLDIPAHYNVRLLDVNKQLQISSSNSNFANFTHLNKTGIKLSNNFLLNHEMPKAINRHQRR